MEKLIARFMAWYNGIHPDDEDFGISQQIEAEVRRLAAGGPLVYFFSDRETLPEELGFVGAGWYYENVDNPQYMMYGGYDQAVAQDAAAEYERMHGVREVWPDRMGRFLGLHQPIQ